MARGAAGTRSPSPQARPWQAPDVIGDVSECSV
jgi:hypothetical protein